ncbi:MAG: site-specific integrase [Nanoarchaeota archaeon]
MTIKALSSIDEYALISGIEDPQHRLLFLLFLRTGMTVHEMATLRVGEFDMENDALIVPAKITKNKKSRKILLPKELMVQVLDHIRECSLKRSDYLLSTRQSKQMTERRIQQIVRHHTERIIGIPLNPRVFRHSFIINAFKAKVPVGEIEEMVGIRSIQQYIYMYFADRQ